MEVMSMNSIVIYASRYGNTKKIAEAIADGLRSFGTAQLFAAEEAPTPLPSGIDLIVIGGPTEMHKMTEPLAEVLRRIESETLHGVAAAAFDTRLRWPRWLAGSAGVGAWNNLQSAGARMIAPAESFFVKKDEGAEKDDAPKLEPGELERATQWAATLAEKAQSEPAAR
jgi:flavodoxin